MTDDATREYVNDVVKTISAIADSDRETARDHYHFSLWLAALATAGVGFLLMQGPGLVQNNPQIKGWIIITAAIGLFASLILSAFVQWYVAAFRKVLQSIKGDYQSQRFRIIRGAPLDNDKIDTLLKRLVDGDFIPKGKLKDRWDSDQQERTRAEKIYRDVLKTQWCVVLAFYLVAILAVL